MRILLSFNKYKVILCEVKQQRLTCSLPQLLQTYAQCFHQRNRHIKLLLSYKLTSIDIATVYFKTGQDLKLSLPGFRPSGLFEIFLI